MVDGSIFAGPALRRLRKREGMTQAGMAATLGISPSYLNLIERNQRPLSARVLVQVIEQFDFDPRNLREEEAIGGVEGLARRLADERFSDLGIDRDEVSEFLATTPQAAAAFARLYDNAAPGSTAAGGDDALSASRREIERWRNHFADLDHAAEQLADEMRLSRSDIDAALTERLREKHQLSVRILPLDVMPGAIRRLDLHARQLQLSEMLDRSSRNFQIALQIAQLEQREAIDNLVAGAQLTDASARQLFERHLTGYVAAALLMPYGRFLRACDQTGYDLTVLQRRFGTSFEQVAHRLTTLQRVGQRGLPFFMARVDRAGQFSKRFSGASGATILESEASCPLWIAHEAFERRGELCVQAVMVDGADAGPAHWFTMARTVEASGATGEARFAIILGVEARLAGDLAATKGERLDEAGAQPIGMGCARCQILGCRQRSLPPRGLPLHIDRIVRGLTPFEFQPL
ncbi:short-chain fatty acyl-CoA regulator family protein [Altererythrobacter arenosus]|uniref:Short-chain fatty acyl-CoA regulator family protein n=1 Tax=Altererythrobacter arenosus TaxID=3032592 RepID=A0ABY8FPG4_9SPHN|nr:helix-turn-helix transcriptional regulator [Altererythrobacter sp. CAU 1644]WFL76901.1 short-chain fatty acyl-CoA regulator family protein [Altererythrobacter sp. CAU 1644]